MDEEDFREWISSMKNADEREAYRTIRKVVYAVALDALMTFYERGNHGITVKEVEDFSAAWLYQNRELFMGDNEEEEK